MQLRPAHQAAADRQHLLLAARHGARRLPPPLGEAREQGEHLVHRRLRAAARARQERTDLEVLLDRERREDLAPLGDLADTEVADPVARLAGDVGAAEADASGPRPLHAGDGADQAGLAGAVGADDGDQLAAAHLQRDAVQRLGVAVEEVQPVNLEDHTASSPR